MDILDTNDFRKQPKAHIQYIGLVRIYYIAYLFFVYYQVIKSIYWMEGEVNANSTYGQVGLFIGLLISTVILFFTLIYNTRICFLEITLNAKVLNQIKFKWIAVFLNVLIVISFGYNIIKSFLSNPSVIFTDLPNLAFNLTIPLLLAFDIFYFKERRKLKKPLSLESGF